MGAYIDQLFAWFPPLLRTAVVSMLVLVGLILVFKLIAAIKDIIPFA